MDTLNAYTLAANGVICKLSSSTLAGFLADRSTFMLGYGSLGMGDNIPTPNSDVIHLFSVGPYNNMSDSLIDRRICYKGIRYFHRPQPIDGFDWSFDLMSNMSGYTPFNDYSLDVVIEFYTQ
jgi:hypothetical protein